MALYSLEHPAGGGWEEGSEEVEGGWRKREVRGGDADGRKLSESEAAACSCVKEQERG